MFPHPWWTPYTGVGDPMKCKDEWLIVELSDSIRAKPHWKSKYKDAEIAARWKAEIREQPDFDTDNLEAVIEYTFRELAWYEYLEHTFPGIEKGAFRCGIDDKIVWGDDGPDDEALRHSLKLAVEQFAALEFGALGPDYHPGSNQQVVDLVHPSLYPLQYGKTPVVVADATAATPSWCQRDWLDTDAKLLTGQKYAIAKFDDAVRLAKPHVDFGVSQHYQWLPAVMTVARGLREYSFQSYINNLSPLKYQELYTVIARVFNRAVPALNLSLSRLLTPPHQRIVIPMDLLYLDEYEVKKEALLDAASDDDDKWEAFEEYEETRLQYAKVFAPEYERDPPVNYAFDLVPQFPRLKVIVKLANIELAPGERYNGGLWHVEGTINEDIVATVLYYYDSANITELQLAFRCAFEDPNYEQGDDLGVEKYFGIKDGDDMTRRLGAVSTEQGRLLVFPNCFQHRVEPFGLKDPLQPGHRKILCMFVVDPYNDVVVATDKVPPQQQAWWLEAGDSMAMCGLSEHAKDEIKRVATDWPMAPAEAEVVREALMKERRASKDDEEYCEEAFGRKFSLCEH
jgi:hypothetical protein